LGFISKTDIIEYISVFGFEKKTTQAKDIMNTEILYCQEDEDIQTTSETLIQFKVHHILVKNSEGLVVGLLSSMDLTSAFVQDSKKSLFEKLFQK
jgi:predicted transcriptional regulator